MRVPPVGETVPTLVTAKMPRASAPETATSPTSTCSTSRGPDRSAAR